MINAIISFMRFIWYVLLIMVYLESSVYAKPMDVKAAENIPELKTLIAKIKKSSNLDEKNQAFLEKCLDSKDPVLMSCAAWIIGEINSKEIDLKKKLQNKLISKNNDMTTAFCKIAIKKNETSPKNRVDKLKKFLSSDKEDNPYLRIEAAREIARNDKKQGKDIFFKLQTDKSPLVKAVASKLIEETSSLQQKPMQLMDERYELVLSIVGY